MRVGAVADADRVARAAGRGELRLERLDLGAEDEPAAREHAVDRRRAMSAASSAGREDRGRESATDAHSAATWLAVVGT